jgi:hypothetical protein
VDAIVHLCVQDVLDREELRRYEPVKEEKKATAAAPASFQVCVFVLGFGVWGFLCVFICVLIRLRTCKLTVVFFPPYQLRDAPWNSASASNTALFPQLAAAKPASAPAGVWGRK